MRMSNTKCSSATSFGRAAARYRDLIVKHERLCQSSSPPLGRLAGRQAQTRQVELAVLGIAQVHNTRRDYIRGNREQPRHDIPRLVEPPHMGAASSEIAVGHREVRGLLDREKKLCSCFVEASVQK